MKPDRERKKKENSLRTMAKHSLHQDMADAINEYIDTYGEDARIAKAKKAKPTKKTWLGLAVAIVLPLGIAKILD